MSSDGFARRIRPEAAYAGSDARVGNETLIPGEPRTPHAVIAVILVVCRRLIRINVDEDAPVTAVKRIRIAVVALLGWLDDSVTAETCAIRVSGINRSIAVIVQGIVAGDLAPFGRSRGRRISASRHGIAGVVGAEIRVVAVHRLLHAHGVGITGIQS